MATVPVEFRTRVRHKLGALGRARELRERVEGERRREEREGELMKKEDLAVKAMEERRRAKVRLALRCIISSYMKECTIPP
jgi:hypothetical protein